MIIRAATVGDADALFELNCLFENDATADVIRASLRKNEREIVVIAYMGDEAAGFCTGLITKSMSYRECRMDVESLFVKEHFRKRGIGKALLDFLEQSANSLGIRHFHINVAENNGAAYAMYAKSGYQPSGEVLLEKDID